MIENIKDGRQKGMNVMLVYENTRARVTQTTYSTDFYGRNYRARAK